jgi:hypothetical protein
LKANYTFHEGNFPAECRVVFDTAVFNRHTYGEIQSQAGWKSFYIAQGEEVCAWMRFCVLDGIAKSPLRAPFGSLDGRQAIPAQVLFSFLEFVEDCLRRSGAASIIVKNPPDLYDPERMTLLANFFLTHQYTITDAEVSAVIPVSTARFDEVIHQRKRRKLEQSRTDSMRFVRLQRGALADAYHFIAACRSLKSYRLSIALTELEQFVDRFPDDYLLFAVFHEYEMVAASIAIRVKSNVLYHFISDHVRKVGESRPALILMEGIYNHCFADGISLLDLGTSTLAGKPDVNLLRFKTEIGAQLTHKFTFRKTLT